MKKKYKSLLIKYVIINIIIAFTLIYLMQSEHVNSSKLVILTFLINIIYIIFKLIIEEKKDYSFKMIFWLFNLMFLGISPLFQYLSNTYILKNIILRDSTFIHQNIIILLYMVTFNFVYKLNYNIKNIKSLIVFEKFSIKSLKKSVPILILILILTLVIVGPNAMFIRETQMNLRVTLMGVDIGVILTEGLIYTATLITLININSFLEKKNLSRLIRVAMCIVVVLLVSFPTAKPRFISGTIYLGILLFIKKKFKNSSIFTLIFIIAFLLVMPSLSSARSHTTVTETFENFKLVNPYDYLIQGDSSTYVMGLSGLQYLEDNGMLYGKQIVSNILFFVPRSIWPEKMESLGSWLAEYSNHTHNNMDSPLFLELFIDFGYIGLILFTSAMAYICSKSDYKFWNICMKSNENYFLKYIYPFLIVIFFFLNRGAFMSTFARIVNLLLGFTIGRVLYKNYRLKVN